jgi:hypothetical protein
LRTSVDERPVARRVRAYPGYCSEQLLAALDDLVQVARQVLPDRDHIRRDSRSGERARGRPAARRPPDEALQVEVDRDAVQLDRALDAKRARAGIQPFCQQ